MIAMQYSMLLRADYDMSIIDRRIAEKGHLIRCTLRHSGNNSHLALCRAR